MKRRTLIYTEEAGADLDWIYDTIASASSPATASRYEQRIRAFCEGLEFASERGTQRDEVRPGLRAIGFQKRVTVAFIVEAERVVILRIFYGGVDWVDELSED